VGGEDSKRKGKVKGRRVITMSEESVQVSDQTAPAQNLFGLESIGGLGFKLDAPFLTALFDLIRVKTERSSQGAIDYWDMIGIEVHYNFRNALLMTGLWTPLFDKSTLVAAIEAVKVKGQGQVQGQGQVAQVQITPPTNNK